MSPRLSKLPTKLRAAKRDGWSQYIRTPLDEAAVLAGCRFSKDRAEAVCEFFAKFLRHSKGIWAGQSFELLPWQRDDLIYPLFGWVRKDGTRRYRKAYVEIAKKNGKTQLGAGIGLYLLTVDGEPGAEVYSVATKRDQAAIAHDEAVRMVRASPALAARLKVNYATKVISYQKTNSKYAALSADAAGSEGLNIHGLIVDELHAWTDRPFWESLRYGMAARRQPLTFIITTAGVYDKASIGWQEHEYAERILQGTVDDTETFAYIAAAGPEDDIEDPAVQKKANPSYGVTIAPEELAKAVRDAKNRPNELNMLRRYRFNIWSQASTTWINLAKWDEGAQPEWTLDDVCELPCYIGLDLSSTTDTTALVAVFVDGDTYYLWPRIYVPQETARNRSQFEKTQYVDWVQQGHMVATPGSAVDYSFILADISGLAEQCNIREIAVDRWNATQLITDLENDGYPVVAVGQGYRSVSDPAKHLEASVLSGRVRHNGHPVLRWHVANTAIDQDQAGNIKPNKARSRDRIDGVAATINALGRAMLLESGASFYDDAGLELV